MIVLLKLLLVFTLLVFLIRRGVNVGLTLIAGAVFLGLLFAMSPQGIAVAVFNAAVDLDTLNLLAMVLLITLLGNVLKHMENLNRIVGSLEYFVRDIRVVLASIPAFIGLMPMPGGAMLSAPLAGEVADRVGLDADTKTVVNYWFRHIWEYSFPLYPGIILSSTLFSITFADIIVTNGPLNVAAVAAGFFFILRKIRYERVSAAGSRRENALTLAQSIWPVAVVIAANILFGVDLVAVLLAVLAVLFLQTRFFRGFRNTVFRESITLNLVVLILSVMAFKAVIESSGAVNGLPELFMRYSIPVPLIMFTVPFIAGLLVGLTVGYVGITFPLLAVFMRDGGFNFSYFMLAYVGGYMGVMLSPVHLCLVLSREYYGGDLRRVYGMIMPLVAVVTIATAVLFILGYPDSIL